jgi:hypothetical protein
MIRCLMCGALVSRPCILYGQPAKREPGRLVPFEEALPPDAFCHDIVEPRQVRRLPAPAVRLRGGSSLN